MDLPDEGGMPLKHCGALAGVSAVFVSDTEASSCREGGERREGDPVDKHRTGFGKRRESYSPRCGVPDSDSRVERAGDDAFSVECYGVDLVVMTSEDVQAFTRIDVPQLLSVFE